jgi:hypothetical protein
VFVALGKIEQLLLAELEAEEHQDVHELADCHAAAIQRIVEIEEVADSDAVSSNIN